MNSGSGIEQTPDSAGPAACYHFEAIISRSLSSEPARWTANS